MRITWAKKNHRRKKYAPYGLTEGEYDRMLAEQDGRCAICKEQKKLCIDHDHKTEKVRGLLCNHCNVAIGMLKENEKLFLSAVLYLRARKDA